MTNQINWNRFESHVKLEKLQKKKKMRFMTVTGVNDGLNDKIGLFNNSNAIWSD